MTASAGSPTVPTRVREPVPTPDALIARDATLLHHVDVLSGLRPDGHVRPRAPSPPRQAGSRSSRSSGAIRHRFGGPLAEGDAAAEVVQGFMVPERPSPSPD